MKSYEQLKQEIQRKTGLWLDNTTAFGNAPFDFKYKLLFKGSNNCYAECNTLQDVEEHMNRYISEFNSYTEGRFEK